MQRWPRHNKGSRNPLGGIRLTPRLGAFGCLLLILAAVAPPAISQPEDSAERTALARHLKRTIEQASSFGDQYEAAVWLTDMQARLTPLLPDAATRLQLLRQIHAAARESGLPPELVLAVIEVESGFDRFAVSRAGAQGYMQVMPFWKNEIGRPDDNLTRTETNLRYGCHILQFYIQREGGNLRRALAAYNGSSGSRRYPDKVYRAWRKRWRNEMPNW
jgi:soluble lytic murein transglycosylase-like protein